MVLSPSRRGEVNIVVRALTALAPDRGQLHDRHAAHRRPADLLPNSPLRITR